MRKFLWLFTVVSMVHAESDPFNSLLWNRQNVELGHGMVDHGAWYEWWYFKMVDPASRQAFFFTYGIINPWDSGHTLAGSRAIVQAGNFQQKTMLQQEFPVNAFHASYEKTEVQIGENFATDKHLTGHIHQGSHELSWDLEMTRDWRFEAMGWSMHLPEVSGIYWYPAQASATMTGWIEYDGQRQQFNAVPAYQDRNWGRNFPEWWTWLTSNHFKDSPGTVLATGGGRPKMFNSVYLMAGLCIGLRFEGREYVFRTTDADWIRFDIRWGVWQVTGENKFGQRIEISAYAPPVQFLRLPFQSPSGPIFYDYEALLGHMTVKLYERDSPLASWRLKTALETDEAGIEWGTPQPVDAISPLQLRSLFQSQTSLQ